MNLAPKKAELTPLRGIKLIVAVLLVFVAARAMAQEHPQGTDEQVGEVHFSTSCNGAAQNEINRAVALLHSFQFSRAIDTFKAALGEDETLCSFSDIWTKC
jgi:hypothetical protein